MTMKVIPERHVIICDRCGAEGVDSDYPFRPDQSLALEDQHDSPIDLCETCTELFHRWLATGRATVK